MLVADIDLRVLRANAVAVKKAVQTDLCAVVKADAYGHGAVRVAHALSGVADEFAVATYDEAHELVKAGINEPINVLECVDCDFFDKKAQQTAFMSGIVPTICGFDEIDCLVGKTKRVNVKLNTGMNRLGISADKLDLLIARIKDGGIAVHSIFSHLYNASDEGQAETQYRIFEAATKKYAPQIRRHLCASSAPELDPKYRFDMIRSGIALYGYSALTKPAMSVHTSILQITNVKQGEHISYGDYIAPRDMKVAAIRVGYADGYRRINGKERYVSINGVRCPVVGQVCMDITLVDVSTAVLHGRDRVYLLGGGISGEELACSCDTIVYEILTSFKGRIKRNYVG